MNNKFRNKSAVTIYLLKPSSLFPHVLLAICFILCTHNAEAQRIEQRGKVILMNSGHQSVAGVQIDFYGATPTTSDSEGTFIVVFSDKEYGQPIYLKEIFKKGYEIVNEKEFQPIFLSSDKEMKILLCKPGYLDKMRAEYYDISMNVLTTEYRNNMILLNESLESKKENKELLIIEIQKLEDQYLLAKKQVKKLADKFAKVNFDDVSDLYRRAFNQFQLGNINKAISILEEKDLIAEANKVIQEGKNIYLLKENINENKLSVLAKKNEVIKTLYLKANVLEEKGDFKLANQVYIQILLIDSSNYSQIINYAEFLQRNSFYDDAITKFEQASILTDSRAQKLKIINLIGDVYRENKQDNLAVKNYLRIIDIYNSREISEVDCLEEIYTAYIKLGDIFNQSGENAKAILYKNEATQISLILAERTSENMNKEN